MQFRNEIKEGEIKQFMESKISFIRFAQHERILEKYFRLDNRESLNATYEAIALVRQKGHAET